MVPLPIPKIQKRISATSLYFGGALFSVVYFFSNFFYGAPDNPVMPLAGLGAPAGQVVPARGAPGRPLVPLTAAVARPVVLLAGLWCPC